MNNKILDLLENEVERDLNDLKNLTPGTQDYGNAVVDLCKLYELRLKEKSNENSHAEKQAQMELNEKELDFKKAQANIQMNSSDEEFEFKKEQFYDERERFDKELELKQKQFDQEEARKAVDFDCDMKKIRYDNIKEAAKVGVDIIGIILPLAFYGVWMCKGFKFEETGTYTSTTFKNLIGRFRPTKN